MLIAVDLALQRTAGNNRLDDFRAKFLRCDQHMLVLVVLERPLSDLVLEGIFGRGVIDQIALDGLGGSLVELVEVDII